MVCPGHKCMSQNTSAWARKPVHWWYTKRCTVFYALTTSINKPIGTISTHDRCFRYGGGGVRRGPWRNQSFCVCYKFKLALRCFLTCVSRYLLKAGEARWNDGIIALEAGANGTETAFNKTDVCEQVPARVLCIDSWNRILGFSTTFLRTVIRTRHSFIVQAKSFLLLGAPLKSSLRASMPIVFQIIPHHARPFGPHQQSCDISRILRWAKEMYICHEDNSPGSRNNIFWPYLA